MRIIPSGAQNLLLRMSPGASRDNLFKSGSASGALFNPMDMVQGHSALNQPNSWQSVAPNVAAVAMHPWDAAHQLAARASTDSGAEAYAEPDFEQQLPLKDVGNNAGAAMAAAAADPSCTGDKFTCDWGSLDGMIPGWHLDDQFSGLRSARNMIGNQVSGSGWRVRIGHLDTGYDQQHCVVPLNMRMEMAWNFVDNNPLPFAPNSAGGLLPDPSHGMGTLGLLAGKQIALLNGDFLGGAPYADIVPVRIGNTWLHLKTSALALGINHAVGWHCDIISLSAGGIPSQSWADAVNAAYEAGCCIFAASGDSKGGLPTHLTIYPARFKRVVSVCGVTHAGLPYYNFGLNWFELEGSWGPDSAMGTAISAYAPNVPWAKLGCPNTFDLDGGGTSAATPQAAAAGALWLQKHLDTLGNAQPWQKVEAIRYALFSSAVKGDFSHLGNGKLSALSALNVNFDATKLTKTAPDTIDFALLKELFSFFGSASGAALGGTMGAVTEAVPINAQRQHMLEVEALQLAMTSPQVARIVGDADLGTATFSSSERQNLIDALRTSPSASLTMKRFLNSVSSSPPGTNSTVVSIPPPPGPAGPAAPPALVQSLSTMLATAGDLTLDERSVIVDQALLMLENVYVHLPFKRAMHAIDPVQSLKLLQQQMADLSARAFHNEMISIFTRLRDLHTNYILPEPYQSNVAFLPFRIEEYFDGQVLRYMITEVAPDVSDAEFKPGVVVTHWNGIPIDRAVEINGDREAGSNIEARRARGLAAMTTRWMSMSAPPDEQWVVIRYHGTTADREIQFDWKVLPISQAEGSDLMPDTGDNARALGVAAQTEMERRIRTRLFAPQAAEKHSRLAKAVAARDTNPMAGIAGLSMQTDSLMPSVFKEFGVVNCNAVDYGYLRITTFSVDDDGAFINEFIRIARMLPKNGLIIDVRGNGGGLIRAGERLLQVLTPGPIEPESFQMINTPMTLQLCQNNSFLSSWTGSISQSTQTAAAYSQAFSLDPRADCNDIGQIVQGPVVLIVDALCYSTTDMFAAGFQDHAIGKIMGVSHNTGAGGANVWTQQFLQSLLPGDNSPFKPLPKNASFRVAARRSIRVGSHAGELVEDIGIVPDEFHAMTRTDVLNGNLDLKQHACQMLARSGPVPSLSGQVNPAAAGPFTVQVTSSNVDRIDLYLDGRPELTLDVNQSVMSFPLPVTQARQIEIRGFRNKLLVVAVRIGVPGGQ